MNIYETGLNNSKKIVMIHGACMCWQMLMRSAKLLAEKYHVYLVAVPGHDLDSNEDFTSVEDISRRIESQLISMGADEIDLLYGLSMGGGIAIRMIADNRLKIANAVIDAGITPYELPWLLTRIILAKDFIMTELGKHSRRALALAFPPERYTVSDIDMMYKTMQHMTEKTIIHVFDSTDNYTMTKHFPKIKTKIWYWYGECEKKARFLDLDYVRRHIPNVRFRKISGMEHGQYIMSFPECFAADITKIIQ